MEKSDLIMKIIELFLMAVSIIISCIAIYKSNKSNKIAKKANEIAEGSNIIANEANEIAKGSNTIANHANEFAQEANDLSKIFNSKEHEISENLKYTTWDIIANVRAIDVKAICQPHSRDKIDYSNELKSLEKIQSTPEYLLLLNSIKDKNKRMMTELRIRLFTLSNFPDNDRKLWADMILEDLKNETDLEMAI